MEPSAKKRRLAPKAEKPAHEQSPQSYSTYKPILPVQDAVAPPERSDFESFARHLQDAAMMIYSEANQCSYTSASVLLLRWEDDVSVEEDLSRLEKVFQERYNFRTESWTIPSDADPGESLNSQLKTRLEYARPDHLWIIYYTGYGFVGSDHNLWWACGPQDDAPKLKWDGVKSLLENAPSDMLLLLDTCAYDNEPTTGSNGLKHVISAYTPDQEQRHAGVESFTLNLVEALLRLGTGRPFSTQRLHEEVIAMQVVKSRQQPSNGHLGQGGNQRMPSCFSLVPAGLPTIQLAPLAMVDPNAPQISSPLEVPDNRLNPRTNTVEAVKTNLNADLTFEEMRALVCTTFLGEPSQEMASFKEWLAQTPIAASRINVEGMFHGPPTVLLISMPIAIWDILAADRTCGFLGYVNSHNMTNDYQHLVQRFLPLSNKPATFKELEDGKILLEAHQAAASKPIMHRHDQFAMDSMHLDPMRQDHLEALRHDTMGLGGMPQSIYPEPPALPGHKIEVEDSVEMHEAAEQLKALSHVRHTSHEQTNGDRHPHLASPGLRSGRDDSDSSPEGIDSAGEDPMYNSEYNAHARSKPPRRSMNKAASKQDTRCTHCSHTPFKDSSSLRKHIAAAHTRPFPCAFGFAGCSSTFGSKNEWKRHIASQHLCLNFYRCSDCPQSTIEGKGNEFNRKDLFTQHLRRMHAPFAIKKGLARIEPKVTAEWENYLKTMQTTCLVVRRQPPQRSACPKPDCSNIFEGAGSWDDWTEHVGRHMEKGEANRLGVDRLLAKWALDQGIVERKEDGEYRLVGTERDSAAGAGYYSDGNGNVVPRQHFQNDGGDVGGMMLEG